MNALTDFLGANVFGDPEARRKRIEDAVESLRYSPLRCAVEGMREGLTFRRLTVDGRFHVYYVFTPPRGMKSGGTISIRAVKHAASQSPFLGVREATDHPPAMLTTRDPAADLAVIA